MSHGLAVAGGILLLMLVLVDAFETIILPRRVSRRYRLTSVFYRITWPPWRAIARHFPQRRRESALSWYGPFSLLLLLGVWAFMVVIAFGLLQWADGSALHMTTPSNGFVNDIYFSSTTLFTLMMGDESPVSWMAKWLAVAEAGIGFGLLAVVIGYLPVIYQTFSRREVAINLLDARAGTPPAASELLHRHRDDPDGAALTSLLADWERWAGELLESHLSYPVLAYFRSQHSNQSWLAALTTVLDTSALVIVGVDGWCRHQAQMTFAMARHAVVDLAQVFSAPRPAQPEPRLNDEEFAELMRLMRESEMPVDPTRAQTELDILRAMYEPYVTALAAHLALVLPAWVRPAGSKPDNWEAAPWKTIPVASRRDTGSREHF